MDTMEAALCCSTGCKRSLHIGHQNVYYSRQKPSNYFTLAIDSRMNVNSKTLVIGFPYHCNRTFTLLNAPIEALLPIFRQDWMDFVMTAPFHM